MPIENSVSIETGATTVVGNVTQFVAAEGDLLIVDGIAAIIAAAPSTSSLTLAKPWPGPAVVESTNWQILNIGPYWRSTVTTNKLVTDLLRKVDGGLPLKPDATGSLAKRAEYNSQTEGFLFLQTDVDPFLLYVKTGPNATDWSIGQRLRADPAASTVEAQQAAAAAAASAGTANARANDAQTSAGNAAASEGRAHDWAEKQVDQDVAGPGTRSTLHYNVKTKGLYTDYRNSFYGPLAADPLTRPDGTAIQDGDIYYRTTAPVGLKLRKEGAWTVAVFEAAGALLAANNLSELPDKAAARANLGALSSADGTVTNARLGAMATARLKGRVSAGAGSPEDVTADQLRDNFFPSGAVIDFVSARYTALTTVTNVIPLDDTIPQSTEGAEILFVQIAPKSTTSRIYLRAVVPISVDQALTPAAALFRYPAATVLAVNRETIAAANFRGAIVVEHVFVPGVTTLETYSLRVGPNLGSLILNGSPSGRDFGGVLAVNLTAWEIK